MPAWFSELHPPNATVRVETKATGVDANGGATETWSTVEAGVSALISSVKGGRPGTWEGKPNVLTGRLAGVDESLGRADTRIRVTAGFLAGKALYPTAVETHPAGSGGLPARYGVEWSTVQPTT